MRRRRKEKMTSIDWSWTSDQIIAANALAAAQIAREADDKLCGIRKLDDACAIDTCEDCDDMRWAYASLAEIASQPETIREAYDTLASLAANARRR
jgi:hypothetical protein